MVKPPILQALFSLEVLPLPSFPALRSLLVFYFTFFPFSTPDKYHSDEYGRITNKIMEFL